MFVGIGTMSIKTEIRDVGYKMALQILGGVYIYLFQIIFIIIILNSFSGRFPVSSSFCLAWWAFFMFLYLLGISLPFHLVQIAVFGVAFLFWWSVVPFSSGGFSQWVGLDDWLVKVSWLGKLASVFWCMELDFFSLLSKTMDCFSGCLMSSASDHKLFRGACSAFKCSFDEFVGEKVVSPSCSSAILAPLYHIYLLLFQNK